MTEINDENDPQPQTLQLTSIGAAPIFFIIWVILGICAFIYSLVCFNKSGTNIDKVVGLLISIFFGPFYFIYLLLNTAYCSKV